MRSIVQMAGFWTALGAAVMLLQQNLGMTPVALAEMSKRYWGFSHRLAQRRRRQDLYPRATCRKAARGQTERVAPGPALAPVDGDAGQLGGPGRRGPGQPER